MQDRRRDRGPLWPKSVSFVNRTDHFFQMSKPSTKSMFLISFRATNKKPNSLYIIAPMIDSRAGDKVSSTEWYTKARVITKTLLVRIIFAILNLFILLYLWSNYLVSLIKMRILGLSFSMYLYDTSRLIDTILLHGRSLLYGWLIFRSWS